MLTGLFRQLVPVRACLLRQLAVSERWHLRADSRRLHVLLRAGFGRRRLRIRHGRRLRRVAVPARWNVPEPRRRLRVPVSHAVERPGLRDVRRRFRRRNGPARNVAAARHRGAAERLRAQRMHGESRQREMRRKFVVWKNSFTDQNATSCAVVSVPLSNVYFSFCSMVCSLF